MSRAGVHRKAWAAVGTVIVGLAVGADARATVMVQTSIDQLWSQADLVVVGNVQRARSSWDNGHIVTDVTIAVDTMVRGPSLTTVIVRVPGGAVDGTGQTIAGAPALGVGNEYVLFLTHTPRDTYEVVGLSQGVLPVRSASAVSSTEPRVFPANTTGLELVRGATASPSTIEVPAEGMALGSFVAALRALRP